MDLKHRPSKWNLKYYQIGAQQIAVQKKNENC